MEKYWKFSGKLSPNIFKKNMEFSGKIIPRHITTSKICYAFVRLLRVSLLFSRDVPDSGWPVIALPVRTVTGLC